MEMKADDLNFKIHISPTPTCQNTHVCSYINMSQSACMLRHPSQRATSNVYALPRGDNPQSFVFLRLISFAFGVFEMLKTAFCVCKLIISSMKKYTLITKLQRRYHPCCEQCFIILSIPICFRSAQYYKYFFCLLYYCILLELYYLSPLKKGCLPNHLPFFFNYLVTKNNTFFWSNKYQI